jgi:hypothetical protein
VLEVPERDDRAPDRLVARDRVEARDERDTTGVVLVRRVVEANGTGRSQVASSSSVFGVDTPRKNTDAKAGAGPAADLAPTVRFKD